MTALQIARLRRLGLSDGLTAFYASLIWGAHDE